MQYMMLSRPYTQNSSFVEAFLYWTAFGRAFLVISVKAINQTTIAGDIQSRTALAQEKFCIYGTSGQYSQSSTYAILVDSFLWK